ncbi:MAG: HD domain-containing protein, partial [Clostridiales bacterium]|nr:HD domain-containing protein [Clostridiales bacterium]
MDCEKLLDTIREIYPAQFEEIKKAYDFAKDAHGGQKRISGEDYFIHPCAVAEILLDFGVDHYTLIAAFLHDVLEDTETSPETIKNIFGEKVLSIVEGLTKLSRIKYYDNAAVKAENIRKIFFAMAKDMRVIFIKLADKLHNMRTLDVRTPEKQLETSREALEIFAGLAGRLGISFFKCELEDLAMKYLYPDDYKRISEYVNDIKEKHRFALESVSAEIYEKFRESDIKGEVSGRYKHLYSIFKKLKKNEDIDIAQIYDLIAVRVIVPDTATCYHMLGLVHSMWNPIPDRIKDYIVVPKFNGYQSLHTTVMTEFDLTFEIQIRTYEMHKIAEYGVAAHWKYKEGTLGDETELDNRVRWIREVLD